MYIYPNLVYLEASWPTIGAEPPSIVCRRYWYLVVSSDHDISSLMFEHHLTRGVAIGLFYFQDHDSGTRVTRDSATALQFFKTLEFPKESKKQLTFSINKGIFH